MSFGLGLILVLVAGAELFTGNNLLAMAWASGLISTRDVLRNWLLVYLGNVIGCLGTVLFVLWADIANLDGGAVGKTAIQIAHAKAGLPLGEAFARGLPCNAMVCLALRAGHIRGRRSHRVQRACGSYAPGSSVTVTVSHDAGGTRGRNP